MQVRAANQSDGDTMTNTGYPNDAELRAFDSPRWMAFTPLAVLALGAAFAQLASMRLSDELRESFMTVDSAAAPVAWTAFGLFVGLFFWLDSWLFADFVGGGRWTTTAFLWRKAAVVVAALAAMIAGAGAAFAAVLALRAVLPGALALGLIAIAILVADLWGVWRDLSLHFRVASARPRRSA
jgi:hypothetical protein